LPPGQGPAESHLLRERRALLVSREGETGAVGTIDERAFQRPRYVLWQSRHSEATGLGTLLLTSVRAGVPRRVVVAGFR
jgi:hypothetical protein